MTSFIQNVYAQAVPEIPVGGHPVSLNTFVGLIMRVAQFLIQVAPVFAVIFIIWGGITYMAAGADEEKARRAKARIVNAIIGAAVILGVGLILSTLSQFINTQSLG